MHGAASRFFCSMMIAALTAMPAETEERDDHVGVDSPWHKTCLQGACYVSKSRWSYCEFIGDVALAERNAETGKILSIGLPPRINPERAVRITIDKNEPINSPISECAKFFCRADHAAGAELVGQLKQGQVFVVEAVNQDGTAYMVTITLAGFAEAYDGPPLPLPKVTTRIVSEAEMKASREQSERAADERRVRCGASP